jgi:4'-phosphopantetheinyl transferase EntD
MSNPYRGPYRGPQEHPTDLNTGQPLRRPHPPETPEARLAREERLAEIARYEKRSEWIEGRTAARALLDNLARGRAKAPKPEATQPEETT